ncbi:MAG: ribosome maturation factor RimM, partial [Cyclobacteriaceae bacterium]|nr:ribosome maturation factor RimM [Cyclobacteriaceae bacterium]
MDIDSCFQLGYIVKNHGLKGEVNVFLDVDQPEEYSEMESVFVLHEQGLVPFFIDRITIHANKAIIKFDSVDTVEDTEPLRGRKLFLPLNNLPEMAPDGFYYHDIIGYEALEVTRGKVGEITDFYVNGPQDIFAIRSGDKEILVPVVDDFIQEIDHGKRQILFNL